MRAASESPAQSHAASARQCHGNYDDKTTVPNRHFYPRLLPQDASAGPVSLEQHLARYGPLPRVGRSLKEKAEFLAGIELSGLVGRGGAGFPTAQKLNAVDAPRRPVIIGNGTEGEPASQKDKVLLSLSPHLVLDGAVLVAEAMGAGEAYVVVHPSVVGTVAAEAVRRGNSSR